MCTCLTFQNRYLARNMDVYQELDEKFIIIPRHYPITLRHYTYKESHYALMGNASVIEGQVYFYDAVNEYGLAMAALRDDEAIYQKTLSKAINIDCDELIMMILSQCQSLDDVKKIMTKIRITGNQTSPCLHWIISDQKQCFVLEMRDGQIVFNKHDLGVLTNSPSLKKQMDHLKNYHHYTNDYANYQLLPGDTSSMSRFILTAFLKSFIDSHQPLQQLFRVLNKVSILKGTAKKDHQDLYTVYSIIIDLKTQRYYYQTYQNMHINIFDMHSVNLDLQDYISYSLDKRFDY